MNSAYGPFGVLWWTRCVVPVCAACLCVWAGTWLMLTLVISHKSHWAAAELSNTSVKPFSAFIFCPFVIYLTFFVQLLNVCIFYLPGSVAERSTASSSSTWRNIVQRCACASKIPTAIAITAASSRANPAATHQEPPSSPPQRTPRQACVFLLICCFV